MNGQSINIVIAGGGTGGHLFPGIAIAQEFIAKNPKNRVLFISTGRPFEISVLSKAGFDHKSISAEGIKGRGLWKQVVSISKIPKGVFKSILILRSFRPDLIVGVGSYAAGPVIIGAWLMGIKIVLHEQNILPGITNRILSHIAGRIYVSFTNTKDSFNPKKVHVTGNPVRKEILHCKMPKTKGRSQDRKLQIPFTILVLGGSQGAQSINKAVIEAIEHLKEKDKLFFVHQTGPVDEKTVKNAYTRHGISCAVKSFFSNMAQQYQKADLVICRAGATTVAELSVLGKGVIFIPFPFAADNHQVLNARALTNAGAAEMILQKDLNGKVIAERIEHYASNHIELSIMESKIKNFGKPDAASAIVDDCYKLLDA